MKILYFSISNCNTILYNKKRYSLMDPIYMKKKEGTKAPRVEQKLKPHAPLLYLISIFSFNYVAVGVHYLGFLLTCGNHPSFRYQCHLFNWVVCGFFTSLHSLFYLPRSCKRKRLRNPMPLSSLYSHSIWFFLLCPFSDNNNIPIPSLLIITLMLQNYVTVFT